jgi:hypothetical protein
MPCNGLEPLVTEVLWCLEAVVIVLRSLQQPDCLSWKDLEGPTWDDGHSWHRKAFATPKHESYCCRQTQQVGCPIILLVVDGAPQILF